MILSGWKEIAAYLHCGMRTAQRWEAHGAPIHRPSPGKRSHVIANSAELDRWVRGKLGSPEIPAVLTAIKKSERLQKETEVKIRQLREQVLKLQEGVNDLRAWRLSRVLTRVPQTPATSEPRALSRYKN